MGREDYAIMFGRLVSSNFDRQWSKIVARGVVGWREMGLQSLLWEIRHYQHFDFWVCCPTCHTIRFDCLGQSDPFAKILLLSIWNFDDLRVPGFVGD